MMRAPLRRLFGPSSPSFASRTLSSSSSLPRLRIVSINDIYDLTNYARLQTLLTELQRGGAATRPDAVVLAGDFLGPSPVASLTKSRGPVQVLKSLRSITHYGLGNHEADLRLPTLIERLEELTNMTKRGGGGGGTTTTRGAVILNSNVGEARPLFVPQAHEPDEKQESCQAGTLSSSTLSLDKVTQPFDIVTTSCGRVRVGLLGLLSDEPGIFPDNTFRGLPIRNVVSTLQDMHQQLTTTTTTTPSTTRRRRRIADWILPVTHQFIQRDKQLAQVLMDLQPGKNVILGGHEHALLDVMVDRQQDQEQTKEGHGDGDDDDSVRILKAGMDCEGVHLVDLTFQQPDDDLLHGNGGGGAGDDEQQSLQVSPVKLHSLNVEWIDLKECQPSPVVKSIIDSQMSLLTAMQHEDVLHAATLLPPGVSLSSEGTRFKQTTVGGIFCLCIKEELGADVAILNGASIKGNRHYNSNGNSMTYAQLKAELPFPTKMVVVPMTRGELHSAIYYSRTHLPTSDDNEESERQPHKDKDKENPIERKGFLQVDVEFDRIGFHAGHPDDELMVALPRNLLKGFCDIEPLIELGRRLQEQGSFPHDDFVPAMDLVVRHCSKERWYELVHHQYSFTDLDVGQKGYLTRDDVIELLRHRRQRHYQHHGRQRQQQHQQQRQQRSSSNGAENGSTTTTNGVETEPPGFLVDDMMAAVDMDENGVIDPGEFSHVLAIMEREHNLIRFD